MGQSLIAIGNLRWTDPAQALNPVSNQPDRRLGALGRRVDHCHSRMPIISSACMALRGNDILRLKRKSRFLHALRTTLPCCTAAIDT